MTLEARRRKKQAMGNTSGALSGNQSQNSNQTSATAGRKAKDEIQDIEVPRRNSRIRDNVNLRSACRPGGAERGEITGSAYDSSTGVSPAFLAIPCHNEHADDEDCQAASHASFGFERPRAVLPENVREMRQRRMR